MQKRRKLQWKLLPSYLGITLVSLLIVGWYAVSALTEVSNRQTVTNLNFQARLVGNLVGDRFSFEKSEEIRALLRELGQTTPARISVLVPSGQIVAESRIDVSRFKDRISRPEIEEARAGRTGVERRFSFGAGEEVLYVAIPIEVQWPIPRDSKSLFACDKFFRRSCAWCTKRWQWHVLRSWSCRQS